ncbi:LLM class flavin-dependent oxidoreductase [Pseudonocardia humida]|uniref:LLM class flavin-dependent oxidoreductase n=1 Tax=Pseudonocardia humida TaxID=2800819 RepID=UPI00207C3FA4|nr:LLM class flavin-dependent oxidoreductase [Pseudonocardia humida]
MHHFRFGVVAAPHGSAQEWLGTARRVADLGYSTLLSPDGAGMHAPFVALAAAAAAVPRLRVATFVLAAPLRPPRQAAWEGHSLSVLTGGRFDFGIGTGRPQAQPDAEAFERPWGTGAERLALVRAAIAALRERDGEGPRTPVMVAARGPKALELAADEADVVALAGGPTATHADLATLAEGLRGRAGDRADDIELALNLFLVGDEVQPWMRRVMGVDPAQLHRIDSPAAVRGTPREMADQLLRRRDAIGVTYYAVDRSFVDSFAPVVELLAGRA